MSTTQTSSRARSARGSADKARSFKALDGKTYEVDDDMCVIADDGGVLGLGGVIGGEDTGSTDATTNVFIESAYFDPKRTARTGRKLNIQSDARFRFERGVDPDFVVPGLELATRMVLDICGGEASKAEIAGKPPKPNAPFAFDPKLVKRLSGLDLKGGEIRKLLTALGIELKGAPPKLKAAPPVLAPGHFRASRSRRGGGAARRRGPGSRDADAPRGRRGAPRADRDAVAGAARAARACRPWPGRGRHLVVHPA